ncbi:MAG: ATP-binding protein [Burkholderiales bacterium]
MRSIRRELLGGLLGSVLLAAAIAGAAVYYKAQDEAGALLDYQLRQMALSLRDQALHGGGTIGPPAFGDDFDFAIEIQTPDGARIQYSQSRVRFPSSTGGGHATFDTPDGAWRMYTLQQRDFSVRVAQPMSVRNELAAKAALRTLTPFILLVPLLGLLVWFAVTRGLRPLSVVADAMKARSPSSLHGLDERSVPQEIRPVTSALNDLLARLTRALETQRAFIADAAHALRTPLTALRLQIQLAERASDPAERAAAFETLKQGVDRTTHLVEQLLTLARHEPEAANRALSEVDLGELAADVVAAYAQLAEDQSIDLGLTQRDPHVVVHGERDALRTLLSNLVDNALRYTGRSGRVDVAALQTQQGPALEVTDNGPGIPSDERVRVFDRFYRRPGTDVPGSGLGLAIVQRIAERHGAKVSLDSGPAGRGLTARVKFAASD